MKKNPNFLFLLAGLYVFFACSSAGSESSAKEVSLSSSAGKGTGSNACLLGYAEKLDELLTRSLALEVVDFEPEQSELKYSRMMKNPFYHSVGFAWDGGRTRKIKVANMEVDAPVSDGITLYGLRETTLEEFKRNRRNVTDEELAQMNKQIEKALSGESGNQKVNERLEKLEKMGVDKKTVVGAGGSLGEAAGKVAQAYVVVPGFGDAAMWNTVEQRLYVLSSGVEFSCSVALGDQDVNKEKSIELAGKILAKCR